MLLCAGTLYSLFSFEGGSIEELRQVISIDEVGGELRQVVSIDEVEGKPRGAQLLISGTYDFSIGWVVSPCLDTKTYKMIPRD